jgi:hypothetical protein
MEHNSPTNNIAAALGGSLFATYSSIKQLLQIPSRSSYAINWAETFQVCWKAAIGALVGLIVKFCWDKIFTNKTKVK